MKGTGRRRSGERVDDCGALEEGLEREREREREVNGGLMLK